MNSFGRKFRVSILGESHGQKIGVVLDGIPAGLELSEADFTSDILRRKSGSKGTTPRIESDEPIIVSGLFEGHTTGAPLTILFDNNNIRPSDYSIFADMPRPGHADLTSALKWDDCNDPRGGGHLSGRLTLPIVAAGVIAKKILADATMLDDSSVVADGVHAEIIELGGIKSRMNEDESLPKEWEDAIDGAVRDGDSLGAIVECSIEGLAAGYGEPFWDSVESVVSHAIFSIPGVRGVEFGDGFEAARMKGSEHNDPIGPDCIPVKNGAGGVNGGISNGASIVFRVAFKPTSSIRKAQTTWNFRNNEECTLEIPGRHDVCFALRAPVVVEAMAAIALADLVLINR